MTLARLSDDGYFVVLAVYVVATALHFLALRGDGSRRLRTVAFGITGAGWVTHFFVILFRGIAAGRVPWGNMYEYSNVLVFLLVGFYLAVFARRSNLRLVTPFAMMLAVLSLGLARPLYAPAGDLPVALHSWWLKVHVISMITASSIFSIAFVFTVMYLVVERAERKSINALYAGAGGSTVGAAYVPDAAGGFPTDHLESDAEIDTGLRGMLGRMPRSATLDTWAYRLHAIAFPIWTWGVIAGAVWASKAWGRYWGWDPKETWAFITWVVYAGYLHSRATAGWRGRRAAYVATAGFVSLWITYYAVNLWIAGLHSYAGVK
ncbi:MAG: c-type cytochrome biogenesis protein CcsB [Actinomycetota bacterium]